MSARRIIWLACAAILAVGCQSGGGGAGTPVSTAPTQVLVTGGLEGSGIAPADASSRVFLLDSGALTYRALATMTSPRLRHAAALLTTGADAGRVLLIGGQDRNGSFLASTEIYDPIGSSARAAASMSVARVGHTATVLGDGRILVSGGTSSGSGTLASAEIFDPAAGTYAPAANDMSAGRIGHTATRLNDGRVLIVGGSDQPDCDIFDPATNRFTPSGGVTPRQNHTATLLRNGQVLIAGGKALPGEAVLTDAALFDPTTGGFAATTGSMSMAREEHTATLLPLGHVLIAGGRMAPGSPLATVEVFDPSTGDFERLTARLTQRRAAQTATLVEGGPNQGKVLILGGKHAGAAVFPGADLFDPNTNRIRRIAATPWGVFLHRATVLR